MSHINFDRSAAQANANRAQRTLIQSAYAEQVAKARNAANLRAAILSGLAVGVLVSAAQLLGLI